MELENAAGLTVDDSEVAVAAEHQDVLTAGVFAAADHPPFGAELFRADHPLACHQIQRVDINPAGGEHDRRSMFKPGLVPGMDHLLVRGSRSGATVKCPWPARRRIAIAGQTETSDYTLGLPLRSSHRLADLCRLYVRVPAREDPHAATTTNPVTRPRIMR